MRRLASIFMLSLTICAIGGIAWLQTEMADSKEKFENQLMIRYGQPFSVEVYYDWNLGQFSGKFIDSENSKKEYFIESYSDGTFYDDYLEQKWSIAYGNQLKEELESKGIKVEALKATVERGTDVFLFGDQVLWDGRIELDEALEKGIEERFSVIVELPVNISAEEKKRFNDEKKRLSNKVKKITVL